MEKIPEKKEPIIYAPVIKQKNSGAFLDGLLTVLDMILFVALIASYMVVFDFSGSINIQELTLNTLWFAIGTVSVGMMTKKLARNKGRATKEYKESEKKADEKIESLRKSEYVSRVPKYCEDYTEKVIERERKQILSAVGLTIEEYKNQYIKLDRKELRKQVKDKNINKMQYRAIRKCGRIRIRPYDPNFILSSKSEIDSGRAPSAMYNTEREDRIDTVKSVFSALFSSVFVCSLVSDVLLNLSQEVIIAAVIKVITMLIYICFKTSFGWTIAQKEQKRNELRASEAETCERWCKENKETT